MVLNKIRFGFIVLLSCYFIACASNDLMHKSISFEQPSEFLRQIQQLESALTPEQYNDLTDAIGLLKVNDKTNVSIESFYQSLNNLSPNQIIAKGRLYIIDDL